MDHHLVSWERSRIDHRNWLLLLVPIYLVPNFLIYAKPLSLVLLPILLLLVPVLQLLLLLLVPVLLVPVLLLLLLVHEFFLHSTEPLDFRILAYWN